MLDYLPIEIKDLIFNQSSAIVTEIRLRANKPVCLQIDGKYVLFKKFIFTENDLQNLVLRLTKRSLYAFTENIKKGYISGDFGERIGICGTIVVSDDNIITIKDFTSVCIRIPNEIIGCSQKIADICFNDGIKNLLIVAPPGAGKTTILRDLIRIISQRYSKNILVIDEKNEFSANGNFNLGQTSDILKYSPKKFGFDLGVLNMRPDIIVTDELFTENDIIGAKNACLSGIKIMASCHAESLSDLRRKSLFDKLLQEKIFDCAVILASKNKIGEVKEIIKL